MKRCLLFLLLPLASLAQGIITTVAGSQYVFPDDGKPATSAALASPLGLAADSNGNVYIASYALAMLLKLSGGTISIVAGDGLVRIAGDGGPARAASVVPQAAALDSLGNIYIAESFNHRIRKINPATGIITTVAGTGNSAVNGDGGPATSAAVGFATSVAFDSAGNMYIGELVGVIRKVTPAGIISTIAGAYQKGGFSGDGGPAAQALISNPAGLAVDQSGSLYIADQYNNRIRKIDSKGVITTVAGNGNYGIGGDGGSAAQAMLASPTAVAFDASGNMYIADTGNQRVRKVTAAGIISTIAGSGKLGFSGDGGPALSASFGSPDGIAVDGSGNVYVSDRDNHRIRRIDGNLTITTVAGAGEYTGDGGPATSARLAQAPALAVDSHGNIFIADNIDNRVRKVTAGGLISTLAGTGLAGYGGDGGPAANALLNSPYGVAADASGNVFIADTNNNRIRKVASDGTISTFAGNGNCCNPPADGSAATSAAISVGGAIGVDAAGNLYFFNGALVRVYRVSPAGSVFLVAGSGQVGNGGDGGAAQQASFGTDVQLSVDAAGNVYLADFANSVVRKISATGTVSTVAKVPSVKGVAVDKAGDVYIATFGGNFVHRVNSDGTFTTVAGGKPFGFNGDGGPALNASLADPFGLAFDPSGNLFIADWANQRIREVLAGTTPALVLSPTGLTFTSVAGAAAGLSQSFTVINGGAGTLSFSSTVSTTSGGNWLSVTPISGTAQSGTSGTPVQVQVDPSKLAAGVYYGQIQVSSPGAPNSPQYVTVVLNTLAAGASASLVQPGGLLFVTPTGSSPAAQNLTVSTQSAQPVTFGATASFGSGQPWFTLPSTSGTVSAGKPLTIAIQPIAAGFTPGAYNANITFAFANGPAQNVNLLLVVTPGAGTSAGPNPRATCAPSRLLPLITSLGSGFSITAGWPSTIQVSVVDDCGQPLTSGAVTASFSNADPAVQLTSLRDGRWSGTWQAQNLSSSGVTISAAAQTADGKTTGTSQVSGSLNANANPPPVVAPGGVLNAASYQLTGSLAPGALVSIFGSVLSQAPVSAPTLPLPTTLGSTSVVVAGRTLPLIYAGPNQVNAMIPYDLPINASHQVIVQRGTTLSTPQPIGVVSSQSGVFTQDLSGTGIGIIVKVAADGTQSLVGPSTPASVFDALVIYCTGLGDVNPQQIAGLPVPNSPLSQTLDPVTVTIGGITAPVIFAGLTPGFTGLYQINAYVPVGTAPGDNVPVVITQSGRTSPPVSISVR